MRFYVPLERMDVARFVVLLDTKHQVISETFFTASVLARY